MMFMGTGSHGVLHQTLPQNLTVLVEPGPVPVPVIGLRCNPSGFKSTIFKYKFAFGGNVPVILTNLS
jgi:hypothetical protein